MLLRLVTPPGPKGSPLPLQHLGDHNRRVDEPEAGIGGAVIALLWMLSASPEAAGPVFRAWQAGQSKLAAVGIMLRAPASMPPE